MTDDCMRNYRERLGGFFYPFLANVELGNISAKENTNQLVDAFIIFNSQEVGMDKELTGNKESHVLQSDSRVIFAADAALHAVENHFKDVSDTDYWQSLRLQRAALKAALAALDVMPN